MQVIYGESFYDSETLYNCAKSYLKKLPKDVTHLITRGASGCAIASAMLVLADRPLKTLVIRKGEKVHSSAYTGFCPIGEQSVAAIVDDMISTGDTIEQILKWDEARSNLIKYVLVGQNYAQGIEFSKKLQLILVPISNHKKEK
jgi:orotate phosphoribosyltransferase